MKFYPTMHTRWSGVAPGTPEEVAARLEAAIAPRNLSRTLSGTVDAERFSLRVSLSGKNSWRPNLSGTLQPCGDNTWIDMTLAVHPFVLVFTIVHGFLLLGIAWVMGIVAFAWEVEKVLEVFTRVTQAEAVAGTEVLARQVFAAPDAPGAEAGAPWSLRARLENEAVRFRLSSPGGWLGAGPWTHLIVNPLGVEADGQRVAWSAIRGVQVVAGELQIAHDQGVLRLNAAEHAERDLRWLADYLAASAARTGVGTDDEHRLRAEARVLSDVGQRRRRETEGSASS